MSVKVHKFSSESPETPYAPVWDYCIAEKKIDIDVDKLADLILSNRGENIANFFNVLKWDIPVCKDLLNEIKIFHTEYVKNTCGKFDSKLKIRCWSNVMHKGQDIKQHYHSTKENSYLSGHFTVKCDDSSTNYYHPYDHREYPIENSPNMLTLFPTWITHGTSIHKGDSERITIAFDLILESTPLSDLDSYAGEVSRNLQNDIGELVFL